MNIERVKRLLKQKENIRLEFKEAVTALPTNLFETICAMLNRDGGDILLGVQDDGTILGVNTADIGTIVTSTLTSQKYCLFGSKNFRTCGHVIITYKYRP